MNHSIEIMTKTESVSLSDFYVGLSLAASSSIFIGTSFIFTKKGLLQLTVRAGHGGYGYLKQWLWWTGLILMGVGEAANFAAYAFAPATLVTPLGALSVLVSAILSSRYLKENLNLLGKLGCLVCIVGSIMVIIHAPRNQDVKTMDELVSKMQDSSFITYVILVAVSAGSLIFYASPRWGQSNPLVYITITGTIGSISVVGCKGLGVAIKQTLAGSSQLANPLTWLILFTVVSCIIVQMVYLNRALDVFNTAIVTPLLYVIFTGCVILSSAILFREWTSLGAVDIIGNVCGLLTIVAGIFLIQAFREVNLSWRNLPKARKEDLRSPSTTSLLNTKDHYQSSYSLDMAPFSGDKIKKSPSVQDEFSKMSFHVRASSFT